MLKTAYLRVVVALSLMAGLLAVPISLSAQDTPEPVCPVGGYAVIACPVRSDAVIRAAVKMRLAGLVTSACCVVDVQVNDGTVTLRGQVDNSGKISLATVLASSVRGVVCVCNQLTVWPVSQRDAQIAVEVRRALGRQMFVANQIRVLVSDGVVELTGAVATRYDSDMATIVAESVDGVTAVYNNLMLTDPSGGLF